MLMMSEIPQHKVRIMCLGIMVSFESEVEYIRGLLETVDKGLAEVRQGARI